MRGKEFEDKESVDDAFDSVLDSLIEMVRQHCIKGENENEI